MGQLGFLGLGIMGAPMAGQLLKSGHRVALWSHQGAKARAIAVMGHGVACSTPQEVAEQSDYIFYCVGDSDMARSVTLGPDGLLQGVKPGTVVADCSTILPATSREIGKAFLARGAQFLDAPCTGSVPGAENATLTFMVGGDRNAFESAKPYFQMMGTNLFYCGGPGQGLHAKLAQNLILACMMEAFAEGIVLSTKAGLDPNLMLSILNSSAAKSGLIAYKEDVPAVVES